MARAPPREPALVLRGPPIQHEDEAEALRRFGVNLSPSHFSGYRYTPSKIGKDLSAVPKPWERDLLADLGDGGAVQCETIEGWNNEEFLFEVRNGIAYCTMNRPTANNSMNHGISAGLHDAARILRSRPDIRVAVLTGRGRMFCAGGDPKAFQAAQAGVGALGPDPRAHLAQTDEAAENPPPGFITQAFAAIAGNSNVASAGQFARDMMDWASLPQFTIACMNGSAMGGGVGLLCNCDMVVAVRTAHASLSEVKLGVIPAVISPHVIRAIGTANARTLFCTAENCNMKTALEIGLVQKVVNDVAEFPDVVKEMARKIQLLAPGAVAAAKWSILHNLNQPLSQPLLDHATREYARIRKTAECEQAMKALAARQRPPWVDDPIDAKSSWDS